ncbi:MAG: hypothetical protein EAZ87_05770 [Nostocales cyanobacterium]|nr:MAG: hypothetical protein EAZ87_05770 [Nostocales cyanobacterium]
MPFSAGSENPLNQRQKTPSNKPQNPYPARDRPGQRQNQHLHLLPYPAANTPSKSEKLLNFIQLLSVINNKFKFLTLKYLSQIVFFQQIFFYITTITNYTIKV